MADANQMTVTVQVVDAEGVSFASASGVSATPTDSGFTFRPDDVRSLVDHLAKGRSFEIIRTDISGKNTVFASTGITITDDAVTVTAAARKKVGA